MAITAIEYKLLRDLSRGEGVLPQHPAVVEFGESNWYGDVPLARLRADVEALGKGAAPPLLARLEAAERAYAAGEADAAWELAKIAYAALIGPSSLVAIDMGGRTAEALKLDLNAPVDLGRQFDLAINFGTAEHIFDVRRFFTTVHELTRPGGLMIHGCPYRGWLDHGFYNIQPTFYADLALANGYAPVAMLVAELDPARLVALANREHVLELAAKKALGENGMFFAVLRKGPAETPFRVPMQGYYSGTLSDRAAKLWEEMR